ncbi:SGNH/GDSL hydrolase family protein [Mycolicibacterium sp. P1-18]|uniref:SGNH/GDSL hydrolase family protein n=1 Tax=Mycolicibacterium sp. P1-18 TaxID=2024615 RepID=UPI0011F274CE|nr:SGNH/GDSL hydrolase family protein [Mycolicibacterium sp. P1-18]KAA0098797.1 SGNH/GDSL hydrolase family protein [Mycolicibacterium sp. P1-18]
MQSLQADQPYAISIIGDSTGNYSDEWVYLLMRHIANDYGRSVTIHDWDVKQNAYTTESTFGTGAPVVVWNGSAVAKATDYSLKWFDELAPNPVNLTIISHGHNDPSNAASGILRLVNRAYNHTLSDGGVIVVLQNPRTDSGAEARAQALEQIRREFYDPASGVYLLDVNKAFKGAPDLPSLLRPDGIHPNQKGSKFWADAAASILKLR